MGLGKEWDDNNYLTRTRLATYDDIGAYKARIYYSIFKTIERNDMLGPYITSWVNDKTREPLFQAHSIR